MSKVRQEFLNFYHNHEGIALKKVKAGPDLLYFNNYSEIIPESDIMLFQINDADRVAVVVI